MKVLEAGDVTRNALQQIAMLLHRVDPLSPQLPLLPPPAPLPWMINPSPPTTPATKNILL